MGSGIALVTAEKAGVPVRVQEMNRKALDNTMGYAYKHLQKKVKRRRLKPVQAKQIQHHITGSTDYSGFANCDLVIEAAFESLEVKHEVIKNIEKHAPKGVIIATKTSSIPIIDIAKGAKKPENVIGMHYFSPVEKRPYWKSLRPTKLRIKPLRQR